VAKTRKLLQLRREARQITALPDPDLEHFLWREGYEDVFRRAAGPVEPGADASTIIHQALRACSKPGMALEIAEGAGELGCFPASSIWPLWTAATMVLIVLGPVFGWWISLIGLGVGIWSLTGWVYEYYRGDYKH